MHSPFVFNLVRDVFYSPHSYYAFETINVLRKELCRSDKFIEVQDYGAGSKRFNRRRRKVGHIARYSSIAPRYGELLYRLLCELQPNTVIELGTSLGISGGYLGLSDTRRKVITIEGCAATAALARTTFQRLGCDNVQQIIGQFQDVLPSLLADLSSLDFVLFDGHHQKEATLDYFNLCLTKAHNHSVFVFDDIHWSQGMEEAWETICQHPRVTVSMDLFRLGIVFFRKECQKQHFVVRY
ncbi:MULTISPECIES: O-methyltransferase [unclassified Carboxylicivirga]|uniref:O-methyltransferase n=1 Tax=Carboxylicivirga TaxID=1628153 RepID=UPI003D33FCB4